MAYLGAPLPAEGAATVSAAVDAKAEQIRTVDAPRTKAQRWRGDWRLIRPADLSTKIKKDNDGPSDDETVPSPSDKN